MTVATPVVQLVPDGTTKVPARKRRKTLRVPKLAASEKRTVGQFIAAFAASFMPVASYVLSHFETQGQPMMWALVVAALMFSAPTLIEWAEVWCKNRYKAIGFTVLLEGVMVLSSTSWLALTGLAILVAINCHAAWAQASRYMRGKT